MGISRSIPFPEDPSITRILPGDEKIHALLIELDRIADETKHANSELYRARFKTDPPENERVRQLIEELHGLFERYRNAVEDLRLHTEPAPRNR